MKKNNKTKHSIEAENSINKPEEGKIVFQYNSPVSEPESYSQYIEVLKEAIDKPDICNIGVVSPYGSGKSSLIQSFLHKNKDIKNSTNIISLASFPESISITKSNKNGGNKVKGGSKQNSGSDNGDLEQSYSGNNDPASEQIIDEFNMENDIHSNVYQNRIEKSILEQIIYRNKPRLCTKSRLENNHKRYKRNIIFSLFIALSLASLVIAFLTIKEILFINSEFVRVVFCILPVIFISLTIFWFLNTSKFSRISLKDVELEFDDSNRESILNTYIDEIITYCQESGVHYFIFEDIDRFKCIDIFLKLREINKLINDSGAIENKVVFIYCVKEEVFKTIEDRAKFFDFLISIVPVYNPDIGHTVVTKAINGNAEHAINEDELMELTNYVSDIRVLHNIINDYFIYKSQLPIKKECNVKLFAMMIYKNLCFNDFSLLQIHKGKLFEIFETHKHKSIESLYQSYEKEINDLEVKLEQLDGTNSFKEEYKKMNERINGILSVYGKNSPGIPRSYLENISCSSYGKDDIGYYLKVTVSTPYYSSQVGYKNLSSEEFRPYLDGKTPFELQQDLLEKNASYYKKLVSDKKFELESLRNISLQKIIEAHSFDESLFNIENNGKFVKFVLTNGYIDETYYKYTGRPDTALDNEFYESVLRNEKTNFEKNVQNPSALLLKISKARFASHSVLNCSLIDALLVSEKSEEKINSFIEYVSSGTTECVEFLSNYFIHGSETNVLLKLLKKQGYISLFSDLKSFNDIDDKSLVYLTIALIDANDKYALLSYFNKNESIKEFLENDSNLIERYMQHFKKKEDFLEFLNAGHVELIKNIDDCRRVNNVEMNKLLGYLFENSKLEINKHNLEILTSCFYKKEVVTLNDLVTTKPDSVSSFFKTNLKATIKALFDIGKRFKDSDEIVKSVVLDANLDNETKGNYLSLIENKIDNDDSFGIPECTMLISNNVLKADWSFLEKLNKKPEIPSELMEEFIIKNIDSFTSNINDSNFFVEFYNLEKTTKEIAEKMCTFLKVNIDPILINDDLKRSILIKSEHEEITEIVLQKCDGKVLSIAACLEVKPELAQKVNSLFKEKELYIELIKFKDVSESTKCIVINNYLSDFVRSLKKDDVDIIKGIVFNPNNLGAFTNKDFFINFISLIEDKDDKIAFLKKFLAVIKGEDLVQIIKIIDNELYLKLSPGGKIKEKIENVEVNYLYSFLEEKDIIQIKNRRVEHCSIIVLQR